MSSDLATRIADVKKKAEVAKEAAEIVRKNPHRSDWFEEGEYRQATPPDLIIEMADEIDRLKAQLEKAKEALEPFAKEAVNAVVNGEPDETLVWDEVDSWLTAGHLRTAARVHAELAGKEKE